MISLDLDKSAVNGIFVPNVILQAISAAEPLSKHCERAAQRLFLVKWHRLLCQHRDVSSRKSFYFKLRNESRTLVSKAREGARSLSFAISDNALSISA